MNAKAFVPTWRGVASALGATIAAVVPVTGIIVWLLSSAFVPRSTYATDRVEQKAINDTVRTLVQQSADMHIATCLPLSERERAISHCPSGLPPSERK
jgi:hypothetical protein